MINIEFAYFVPRILRIFLLSAGALLAFAAGVGGVDGVGVLTLAQRPPLVYIKSYNIQFVFSNGSQYELGCLSLTQLISE